jgi:hypothetical protein
MGPRSAPHDVPPIEIESFTVEHALRSRARPVAVERRPPGYAWFQRVRHQYELAIGAYRGFDPRTQSSVEHRIGRRATDVIEALQLEGAQYDPFEDEFRVPIDLHVPWSWPDLPMWLSVGEVSSTVCRVRLSLRSRRRLRYPRRYFSAAHAAVTRLERALDDLTATTRWGSGSRSGRVPA